MNPVNDHYGKQYLVKRDWFHMTIINNHDLSITN